MPLVRRFVAELFGCAEFEETAAVFALEPITIVQPAPN